LRVAEPANPNGVRICGPGGPRRKASPGTKALPECHLPCRQATTGKEHSLFFQELP